MNKTAMTWPMKQVKVIDKLENQTHEVIFLTVYGVISEGTLGCLAWHIDNGASWTPGNHTMSHNLTTETKNSLLK